jgi:hypothetical protein
VPTPPPTPDLTFFGAPWDSTLAAAVVAASVATLAALLTLLSWYFTHRQIRDADRLANEGRNRTEAFAQYHAAVALIASGNSDLVGRGLDLIEMLMDSEWVSSSVRDLAVSAIDAYTRPRSQ